MRFLTFIFLLISTFLIINKESSPKRSPASDFLKEYGELKEKVEKTHDKETVFDRFLRTFNNRIPNQKGVELVELNKGRAEDGSFLTAQAENDFRRVQREFYTGLISNQFKFIEEEAKKDPSLKKTAESLKKNMSPELEQDVGGFKFKTKTDLLRGFASMKMESSWIKSEARYRLSGGSGLELLIFKDFNLLIPVHTEFCYRANQQTLESRINAYFSENLSFNVIQNVGEQNFGSYVLQFDTRF